MMLGYAIAEKLSNGYVIGHFSRSNTSFPGISEALMQDHAKYMDSLKFAFINIESDLGLESMRRSK
ncbi:MAG: hypothetical protein V1895_02500, partial [Parcubacteria group bacterium]